MTTIESTLLMALRVVTNESPDFDVQSITPDTDIISMFDSFVIVDLLLETESALERVFGQYVGLGDETVFDAEKSPLRKWRNWVAYVEARYAA